MIKADPSWSARWPGAQAGFLALQNVSNPTLCPALESRKQALENELRLQFGAENAAALPGWGPLPAYAAYYRAFDKTYHVLGQLKSVAVKGKAIPSVAALVEAMFIAELHNGLLTAGHDLARVSAPVRIAAAQGGETYLGLRGETLTLKTGDMYIADQVGILSSILSGPDGRTPIQADTQAVLFTVYAPAGIPQADVQAHLDEIHALVRLISPQASLLYNQILSA
jgi:DNA/RNA-binding domain of Phe-tRNA-synthetase-like protein